MSPPPELLRHLRAIPGTLSRVSHGFSGANVWSVQSEFGRLALKSWTDQFDAPRVERLHRLQSIAPKMPRLIPLAFGRTFETFGGVVWEAAAWQPGSPAKVDAPQTTKVKGLVAIADIHIAWSRVSAPGVVSVRAPERSPTLTARQHAASEMIRWLRDDFDRAARFDASPLARARDWIAMHGRNACDRVTEMLERLSPTVKPNQYVLRDVHREHVLFDDGEVTAVLDIDAAAFDHPIVDVARWWGSFPSRSFDSECIESETGRMRITRTSDALHALQSELTQSLAAYGRRWSLAMGTDQDVFASTRSGPFGNSSEVRTWATIASEIMRSTAWLSLVRWYRWETVSGGAMQWMDRDRRVARLKHWLAQSEAFPPL